MKQRTTVLVARQDDLSRVYEACKQKVTYTRNPVTLLTTEKNKFNEWINGTVKLIADHIAQSDKNDEESKATFSITSLENDRGIDIVFFLLVHNITGPNSGSAGPNAEIVLAPATGERCYEDRGSAHARKITASPNNQPESFSKNSSSLTKLEDLQWTDRPIEESYRRHFLDSFIRYNAILRAHGNYYASRTSRYTTVQSSLITSGAAPPDNPKRTAIEDPHQSFKELRESQTYRIILPDRKSNALTEREDTNEARNWFAETFTASDSAIREADGLLKQSELLRIALQKADNINTEMLNHSEADLQEIMATDRQGLEKANQDIASQNQDRQRSNLAEAARLRQKERSLEIERHLVESERQNLNQERQEFMEMKEEFERYRELSAVSVREERSLMAKQRNCLEQDRRDLLAQRAELQRLDLAKLGNFRGKERSLEDQRRGLDQDKQEFLAVREDFERTNDLNAMSLREKEASLEKQRLDLEYTRLELSAERERLRQQEIENASSLRERERSMDQEYRVKVGGLREKERSMDQDYRCKVDSLSEKERSMDQDYRCKIDSLSEKERSMDRDYTAKIDSLREKERSMDRDYRAKVGSLTEKERSMVQDYRAQVGRLVAMEGSMENQRRALQQYQRKLGEEKEELKEYYEEKVSGLREKERSVEKQRRGLERERENLSTRAEEVRAEKEKTRSTSPSVIVKYEKERGFKIPIIPYVLSWHVHID